MSDHQFRPSEEQRAHVNALLSRSCMTSPRRPSPARLRGHRHGTGTDRDALAAAARTSGRSILEWEAGHGTPPRDTLVRLADALGVPPDELLERHADEVRDYLDAVRQHDPPESDDYTLLRLDHQRRREDRWGPEPDEPGARAHLREIGGALDDARAVQDVLHIRLIAEEIRLGAYERAIDQLHARIETLEASRQHGTAVRNAP